MRLKAAKVTFIIVIVAVVLRLFYWQVLRSDDLSAMAEQQHLVSFRLDAPRGSILSSDMSILVSNQPEFLLYGLPKVVKDPEEVSSKLAKILVRARFLKANSGISGDKETIGEVDPQEYLNLKDELRSKLTQDLYWVILNKNVDLITRREIENLRLQGIGFEDGTTRFYPESSSAAHLLGFVGSDPVGKQIGYFGVEGFYNGYLKGTGGVVTEEKDAQGAPILMGKFKKMDAKSGSDLTLHIDRSVQYVVEKKLKEGIVKYGAKSGSVVVMDPATGGILAMAAFPSYDPNRFGDFPKEYLKNPVVAESYEPGSTFKALVMAAAINENLVEPDTKCDICAGPVSISGYTIRTWNNKYTRDSSMSDVIVHSDNTGMVFVGRKLGVEKMYQYIQNFGFGSLTGIDLQDEASPDIRSKSEWKEIDLATATFGQGLAVTPIQMIRAVGAIANKGYLMEPHVVQSIQTDGKVNVIKSKVLGRPISEETAKTVTQMMVDAVHKGEARVFAPKGFKIAGKTGTAQIPVAGHYDSTKTIASFVGFAPAENPKFVMLVKYNEPSSSIYGSETAAPTFFEIAKELLLYYNIAPTN